MWFQLLMTQCVSSQLSMFDLNRIGNMTYAFPRSFYLVKLTQVSSATQTETSYN